MLKTYNVGAIRIVRIELIVNTILVAFATAAVILRLAARRTRQVKLWYDDYTILLCMFLTYFLFGIQIADARFGMRVHIADVPLENIAVLLKMLVAYQLLYGTVQALAKISYLFFYLRIFINRGFIIGVRIVMMVVLAWWTANVLQVFLICRPFNFNWNITITGTCGNRPAAFTAIGAINLITDVAILLLPIPTVWKLQMPTSSKIGICGVFAIGLLICIISIIRMQTLSTLNFTDITFDMINPVFWTVTEPSLAIINACLPIMRHLVKNIFGKGAWFGSKARDTTRGGSKAFERMQEGEYPLTDLHDHDHGVTSSSVAAKKSYQVSENASDEYITEERKVRGAKNGINVTTAWKVST